MHTHTHTFTFAQWTQLCNLGSHLTLAKGRVDLNIPSQRLKIKPAAVWNSCPPDKKTPLFCSAAIFPFLVSLTWCVQNHQWRCDLGPTHVSLVLSGCVEELASFNQTFSSTIAQIYWAANQSTAFWVKHAVKEFTITGVIYRVLTTDLLFWEEMMTQSFHQCVLNTERALCLV